MLSIRLPVELEERLDKLARQTGRRKSALAREAILAYIGQLEDCCLADARARRNRETIPLDEVERQLGFREP